MNTASHPSRVYLAQVTSASAGKRLELDLFDPGDGETGEHRVQVLAPPSGAPNVVPTGGVVVPAPGLADSCRYNPVASPTRGPDVSGPGGAPATDCTVITKPAGSAASYDDGWLRIEIDVAADYSCTTDCWWTLRYDWTGATTAPAERMVVVPTIVDRPTVTTTTTVAGPG